MEINVGDRWKTRHGYTATISEKVDNSLFPFRGYVEENGVEISETWTLEGKARMNVECDTDLMERVYKHDPAEHLNALDYFRKKMGWL